MIKRLPLMAALALVLITATAIVLARRSNNVAIDPNIGRSEGYSLDFVSGSAYPVDKSVDLQFQIRDQANKLFKNFETDDDYLAQVIVIRKDRTNFQQLHPTFNEASGTFTINSLKFPTDGTYRVFAVFTPKSASSDPVGTRYAATPYEDVAVGNNGTTSNQHLTFEKFADSANGYTTRIVFAPDVNPGPTPNTFTSGQLSKLTIAVDKNGEPDKTLDSYKGSVGRLAAIGPNLELVSVNSQPLQAKDQSGVISFGLEFPTPGLYQLFLQTKSNRAYTTTQLAVSVSPTQPTSNNPKAE